MSIKIAIGIYVTASLIALLHPRFAILLIWPVLYCYPSYVLMRTLPLNAGWDDLFLLLLFIGSIIRSRGRLQVKRPFVLAILCWLILVFGDLASIIDGDINLVNTRSVWLKGLGFIFLIYSLCSMITTPKQIRRMVSSLLFSAFIGAIFVFYYNLLPYAYNPFHIPYWLIEGKTWEQGQQIIGPLQHTAIAGAVFGFTILIGYFQIRFAPDRHKRPIIIIVTTVLVLALTVCTARKGWVFVLVPVILSSLLSKQKLVGILLLGGIAIGIVFVFFHFEVFSKRISQTVWQATGNIHSMTSNRWQGWMDKLTNPKINWLFCGEGFVAMVGHVHNNYIAILSGMGLMGVLFWSAYYIKLMKECSWLKRYDPNPDMAVLFHGIFWSYIGYFVYCIPSTPVEWANVRYLDFFLMTLIHLRYKQIENEAAYVYQEDLYEAWPEYELSPEQEPVASY